MKYIVSVNVNATYDITVEADSEETARDIAENTQSTRIREEGHLVDVETSVNYVNEDV